MAQGKCKDALAGLQSANPLGSQADTISTGWHTALAAAYMCTNSNALALEEIQQALTQPTTERLTLKAMIYYNLGSYDLVIETVDDWVKLIPNVRSDRYFLRALAHLELSQRDLAREDLQAGQDESWDLDGIGLFASGRLARDSTTAASFYRQSESRMRKDYAPLLRRVHNYLIAVTGG
jgi:tetratricopeptide (TPR) repeat protein